MQHYQQALEINRRHRSAHEQLGELYLALGEPAGKISIFAVRSMPLALDFMSPSR